MKSSLTLPHSLEAERAVLGAILLDDSCLLRALEMDLTPEDFYHSGHRKMFSAMVRLQARGVLREPILLIEEMTQRGEIHEVGGAAGMMTMVEDALTLGHLEPYAALLKEHTATRALLDLAERIAAAARDGDKAAEIVESASAELARSQRASGKRFGVGLGDFLAQQFPPVEPIIEGILTTDGGGWRAGEEKLGKTLYSEHEAICIALGLPVLGRFAVPVRRRVLFIEEEDPPTRTHRRIAALLRGHNINPDDPAGQADLNEWFRIAVWEGFSLDDPKLVTRLDGTIREFRPAVVYLDALRKFTTRDLNKADQASAVLSILDGLRRDHGVLFLVVHHYRKNQGFRTGRGSQEISGSFVLGAWGESSLFFEPIGRKQGAVRVEAQSKDAPPMPPFKLLVESEGPPHDPRWIRLRAEDLTESSVRERNMETVLQALQTLPATEAIEGKPGVPVDTLAKTVKLSDKTVRECLKGLREQEKAEVVGKGSNNANLWSATNV